MTSDAYVSWGDIDKSLPPCPHCGGVLTANPEISRQRAFLYAACSGDCTFSACTGTIGPFSLNNTRGFISRQFAALMWQLRTIVDIASSGTGVE